ncbi:MAG: ATP-binding protein [Caldilineaceae bacterium]
MIIRRQSAFSEESVTNLLKTGQSDQLAMLPGKSNARMLAETFVAMANADGGLAVLGVTSNGAPQKNADPKALRQLVAEAGLLSDPPLILPSAQVVPFHETEIVVVEVPAGLPHVYSLQGSYFTRTAGQNRPLTTPELRRLLLDRGERGYESQPVEGTTLADLDSGKVNRYLDHIAAPPDADPVRMLQARGCVTMTDAATIVPTVAGILLFGQDPHRFLRSAEIICVRYGGATMSDEFVRQDISGTLPEQLRQAEAFVTANMRRGMRITGLSRQDTTEYPIPVVREAIVNAVAHRDYSIRGEGIRLLMFGDRLEVYSPGRLPGHVTLANLKEERYSRNEAIVAILSDLGYIERLGYGIDRMLAAMSEAGLPEPKFEETAAGFRVTLFSAGNDLVSAQPQTQRWHHGVLNERQEMAMAFVRDKGRITNGDYQDLVPDVSEETIRRDLADLVEKNLLIRIGAKKATYYILK